jgi:general secretion pathway protein M
MEALRNFWSQRAPRERMVLGAAGIVMLAAAIFLLLIEPAAVGIPRLERQLPVMRTQAEQLDRLLAEVAGLKASRIVPLADGDLQLTFANASYATWSTWLAGAERELGAKASVVTARATGTPGMADIEMSLRLARP